MLDYLKSDLLPWVTLLEEDARRNRETSRWADWSMMRIKLVSDIKKLEKSNEK